MEKICFKSDGTKETGTKIIKTLENLGGVNENHNYATGLKGWIYYIDEDSNIIDFSDKVPEGYILENVHTFKVPTFPRVMVVSDDSFTDSGLFRVVWSYNEHFESPWLAYDDCETLEKMEENKGNLISNNWKYAVEVSDVEKNELLTKRTELLARKAEILTEIEELEVAIKERETSINKLYYLIHSLQTTTVNTSKNKH